MADKLVVTGARGPGLTEIARRTGNYGVQPTDSDTQALEKFADAAIQQNPGFKGDTGDTGPANSTYTTLAALKAAAVSNASYIFAPPSGGDGGAAAGTFLYQTAGAPYTADGVNVIKLDAVPLSTGALVRQTMDALSFKQSGTQAITRPAQAKQRETVSVLDFGAKGDGVTDDAAAINRAIQAMANLTAGSRLVFPRADYLANDRLLLTVSRLAIFLDGCRIIGNPWRYNGSQTPFGSFFVVTGSYCDISGTGRGNSLIQLTGGSEANGITFLHTDGGSASRLTIDGGKQQVIAPRDDTFMTPLSVLNATGGNPSGVWSRVLVSDVELRNAAQYNAQAYGDLGGLELIDSHLHSAGISNQSESRGAGIAVTRGNRAVRVSRCLIEDNKQDGIFQTSAGLESYDLSFTDNTIRYNGRFGISCTEEANFASVAGVGTNGIVMKGSKVRNNGTGSFDTTGGVRVGTFDGVGHMLNVTSSDDIQDNTGYGAVIFTNDDPVNRTNGVSFSGWVTGNSVAGIGLGAKLNDTVRYDRAKVLSNPNGDVSNFGDSRLVSNARGQGTAIASAPTITIPSAGDLFVLTGSTTVNTIAPDPGRTVTLVFAGTITVSKSGNVVMQADFAGVGNSVLQITCVGGSWFKIAGSMNA